MGHVVSRQDYATLQLALDATPKGDCYDDVFRSVSTMQPKVQVLAERPLRRFAVVD